MANYQELLPFDLTKIEWQKPAWNDISPIMLATGGAGGGKSKLVGEKVHGFMLEYPGATGLMLRKVRENVKSSLVPLMRYSVIGNDPRVVYKPSENMFEYANGSMLFWGGLKNLEQREGIRSIGKDGALDIAWMEEGNAFTSQDFDEVLARMRGRTAGWNQLIVTTNPDSPYHWIKQRLIDGGLASVHFSTAHDNPFHPANYVTDILGSLSGFMLQRMLKGMWVQAEGLVFDTYDEKVHLIDSFNPPSDWRRYRVVDFGYVNPFVCQWWAIDNDDHAHMYREIYMTGRTVKDHAEQINEYSADETFVTTICDWDAEDRATLEQNGISTDAARKDIISGIQAVKNRMKLRRDGKPGMYIHRGAVIEEDPVLKKFYKPIGLEQEILSLVWDTERTSRHNKKEIPVDINNHSTDTMRYFCKYLDSGAGAGVVDLSTIYTS